MFCKYQCFLAFAHKTARSSVGISLSLIKLTRLGIDHPCQTITHSTDALVLV